MSLDTFFVWMNSYFKGLSHQKKHLKQLKVPCNKSPIILYYKIYNNILKMKEDNTICLTW